MSIALANIHTQNITSNPPSHILPHFQVPPFFTFSLWESDFGDTHSPFTPFLSIFSRFISLLWGESLWRDPLPSYTPPLSILSTSYEGECLRQHRQPSHPIPLVRHPLHLLLSFYGRSNFDDNDLPATPFPLARSLPFSHHFSRDSNFDDNDLPATLFRLFRGPLGFLYPFSGVDWLRRPPLVPLCCRYFFGFPRNKKTPLLSFLTPADFYLMICICRYIIRGVGLGMVS